MNFTSGLLRRYRKIRGFTMREVADEMGVTAQYYNNIEHGHAPMPLKHTESIRRALLIPKKLMKETIVLDFKEELSKWI